MITRIHAITMPRWGMTMTEGQVVKWLVEVGDTVAPGQEILEIETEKIANVLESSAAGVLRKKLIAEQATAGVGSLLGVAADHEVSDGEIEEFIAKFQVRHTVAGAVEAEAPAARTVTVPGGHINVMTLGEGSSIPAVLIHGFGGDLNSWLFTQAELAGGRVVHALDLPAHGGSSMPSAPMSLESLAITVRQALESLGTVRAHFVAHSLGGVIALLLARDTPALVASLSLISPAGLGSEINDQYIEEFLSAQRRPQMSKALSALFADPSLVRREMVDDVLRFMRGDGVPAALRSLAGDAFPGGRQRLVLREVIASAAAPVQIIWGEKDAIIPSTHSKDLAARAAVRLLPNVGHMAHLETSGLVNEWLAQAMMAADSLEKH
jgi:pyruvate dehydrogenase E2 component (dihydrolipoamide acetyltransferase)